MERKLPAPDKSSVLERFDHIPRSQNSQVPSKDQPSVRTYGSDSDLVEIVGRFETNLLVIPSFSNSSPDLRLSSETPTKHKGLFQFVRRTGSSLRNVLVKTKQLALNKTKRRTLPCGHGNCKCCQLISDKDRIIINGVTGKPTGGNCKQVETAKLGMSYTASPAKCVEKPMLEEQFNLYVHLDNTVGNTTTC